MEFDVLHDGQKIGGNLTQDAAEVFARAIRAHYQRSGILGAVVVVPVEEPSIHASGQTHLFGIFLEWPVQFECAICKVRPEPIPQAEPGKRAVAVGPIRALPLGWTAVLFAGGVAQFSQDAPDGKAWFAIGDVGGRAPAVICSSCTPKISDAIETAAATIPRTDLPACQDCTDPDPTCPGCAEDRARDVDNEHVMVRGSDAVVVGGPGASSHPNALDWMWSRDEHGVVDGIAIRDGITWGVGLWARVADRFSYPTKPIDLWCIRRNGRTVCYAAKRDCLYTFATSELAAKGAEWCAVHPCIHCLTRASTLHADCDFCGNSRVSGEPPGTSPVI